MQVADEIDSCNTEIFFRAVHQPHQCRRTADAGRRRAGSLLQESLKTEAMRRDITSGSQQYIWMIPDLSQRFGVLRNFAGTAFCQQAADLLHVAKNVQVQLRISSRYFTERLVLYSNFDVQTNSNYSRTGIKQCSTTVISTRK